MADRGPLHLIARPADGRGAVARQLPVVERVLREMGLEYRVSNAGPAGHAEVLARQALEGGDRFLVAVGADPTVREVVAGMMTAEGPLAPDAWLSVLAAGSGCDFVRTFGLPQDAAEATARLAGDVEYAIDVGRITFIDGEGAARTTFFPGIAEIGLYGEVQRRAARLSKRGSRAAYFAAFWWTEARFRRRWVRVEVGAKEFGGVAHNVVVGNCQFLRNGIRVSPRSFPGDGLFEVLVYHGPKSDSFRMLPEMFRGEQVPDPNVEELRGRRIVVDADRPLWVHTDGQTLGTTPVSIQLIPEAIRLVV